MLHARAVLSASILVVAAASAPAQQAVVTQITGLPSAINQPNSSPIVGVAINNAGHFAGMTDLYGFDPNSGISYPGVTHSFLATDPSSAVDIGVLGVDPPPFQFPRAETFATTLNSFDQMSAYGGDAAFFGRVIASAWLPTPAYGFPAGLVRLPSLTAPNIDRAYGMNDSGIVVGESRDASNNVRPVRWTLAGGASPIDDIAPAFGPNGRCYAVNNAGAIVGQVNEPNPPPFNNFFQAFMYLPAPMYGLPSGVTVLQAPGVDTADNFGFPLCINQSGQTFGRTGGGGWRPALWLPEPALGLPAGVNLFPGQVFPDAAFIEVDSIGLDFCQFNAVNNQGVAVGEAGFRRFSNFPRPRFFTESHAFIWNRDGNGRFELLEDFLPLNSPWTRLYWGSGINDSNVITALASNPQNQTFQVKITLDGPSCPNGITRQPRSVTACAGDTAAINVVVRSGGGGDVAYQWRKDGVAITDGPSPGGGTYQGSNTLQIQIIGAGVADAGSYDVIASNSCGTLTSSPATLTVNPLVAFTTQPSDAFACVTDSATIAAAVDDPNAGFGWEVEDPQDSGTYVPISDGTNSAHGLNFDVVNSFTNAVTLSNFSLTGSLRVHAAPFNNCGTTLSDPALVTIGQCICTADFNNDGDIGTDADIEAFFACLAGNCCPTCGSADFNGDGDTGTDADIEAFFRVLSGGTC